MPLQDLIPLARAAAVTHDELFPDQQPKESKALDIIALALSALIPLYQRDEGTGAVRALGESEVSTGRFTRGATTLEFANRPPLRSLVVSRDQVRAAIEAMREDTLIAGRVSLARRHIISCRASPRSI
jgi:hypothetical protein